MVVGERKEKTEGDFSRKRTVCVKAPRREGVWCVLRMTKGQYVYKVVSNQMKGSKFGCRGMPKSAYSGYCFVFDPERNMSGIGVL